MKEPKIMWSVLEHVEYKSKLGKSLKNTLRKFNKNELFEELMDMISYYTTVAGQIPHDKRIKSIHSCELKYVKYFPNRQAEKVFNDILGLRITLETYEVFDNIAIPPSATVADMRHGKSNDDGYRGIHVYVQKSHFHYPVEIQFVTERDRFLNQLLHDEVYKYVEDAAVGKRLRSLYDKGQITSVEEFRKELNDVLSSRKEI